MDKVLAPFLNKFVMVYPNDIVIYNNFLKEHMRQLKQVFKGQRDGEIYVKKEKHSFVHEEVTFSGHNIDKAMGATSRSAQAKIIP